MTHFVNVESLNFRNAPEIADETLNGPLFLGHPVKVTGAVVSGGFVPIDTIFDGAIQSGFVSAKFLRKATTAAREILVGAAVEQWLRFDRGQGLEHIAPYFRFVGEMWDAININLDGRDRGVPWSAAAISFVVRQAAKQQAGYEKFKFSDGHARYIHDSIKKRENGDENTPFWGFRITERKPQIGDLICKNRGRWDHLRHRQPYRSVPQPLRCGRRDR